MPFDDLTCAHGCTGNDELYSCCAKACGRHSLCAGHAWQCADCQDDFCESHIVDLNEVAGARYSIYVCETCLRRRLEITDAVAA